MLNNVVRKLQWVLKVPQWPEESTGMLALEGTPEHILVHTGRGPENETRTSNQQCEGLLKSVVPRADHRDQQKKQSAKPST